MNDRQRELVLTPLLATIVKAFLADTEKPRYGLELMKLTGLGSGSLYPALAKLETAGVLSGGKEDIDPSVEGRPARRFYKIDGDAVPALRVQLAELSERYRPPAPVRPNPAQGGASL